MKDLSYFSIMRGDYLFHFFLLSFFFVTLRIETHPLYSYTHVPNRLCYHWGSSSVSVVNKITHTFFFLNWYYKLMWQNSLVSCEVDATSALPELHRWGDWWGWKDPCGTSTSDIKYQVVLMSLITWSIAHMFNSFI